MQTEGRTWKKLPDMKGRMSLSLSGIFTMIFRMKRKKWGSSPSLSEIHSNGFPEETAWLAEQLSKPEFLSALKEEYRGFMIAHDADRSLLRFHYHKLNTLERRLSELDTPLREYPSEDTDAPCPPVYHR